MYILISYLLWPTLFAIPVWLTHLGIAAGEPFLVFNLTYLGFAAVIGVLERVMPHERQWHRPDGQIRQDIGHTLVTKGAVQALIVFGTTIGIAEMIAADGRGFWPSHWPMWAQAALGLLIAEIGFYWSHRLSHQWSLLWRFHALHHSVRRLWFVNTGRFHFMDTVLSVVASQPLLFLAGAPSDVFIWVSAITAFVGMLSHANIDMRPGLVSYVFNTPTLHRWHHSTDLNEGNRNYGEILIVYDHLFGTFFNPNRRPPVEIGIGDAMPAGFLGQLKAPFVWRRLQRQARKGRAPALMGRPEIPSAPPSSVAANASVEA